MFLLSKCSNLCFISLTYSTCSCNLHWLSSVELSCLICTDNISIYSLIYTAYTSWHKVFFQCQLQCHFHFPCLLALYEICCCRWPWIGIKLLGLNTQTRNCMCVCISMYISVYICVYLCLCVRWVAAAGCWFNEHLTALDANDLTHANQKGLRRDSKLSTSSLKPVEQTDTHTDRRTDRQTGRQTAG